MLGNVKGVVAVVASILWFRNPVNVASMMGYGITVSGVVAYSQARAAADAPPTQPQAMHLWHHASGSSSTMTTHVAFHCRSQLNASRCSPGPDISHAAATYPGVSKKHKHKCRSNQSQPGFDWPAVIDTAHQPS